MSRAESTKSTDDCRKSRVSPHASEGKGQPASSGCPHLWKHRVARPISLWLGEAQKSESAHPKTCRARHLPSSRVVRSLPPFLYFTLVGSRAKADSSVEVLCLAAYSTNCASTPDVTKKRPSMGANAEAKTLSLCSLYVCSSSWVQ